MIHRRLLHHAVFRAKHQKFVFGEFLRSNNGLNRFALIKVEQVDNGRAARLARSLGNLVRFQAIHFSGAGEEQHVAMIRCNEEMLCEVIFFQIRGTLHAFAAAFLLTIQ